MFDSWLIKKNQMFIMYYDKLFEAKSGEAIVSPNLSSAPVLAIQNIAETLELRLIMVLDHVSGL